MKNKEFLKTRFIFQYVKCAEVLVKSILWEHIYADIRVDRIVKQANYYAENVGLC